MTDTIEKSPLKTIPLSKESLEHIFEMCRIVFPEYSNWGNVDVFICYFYGKGKSSSIHWLELCLTHLPDKMYDNEQLEFLVGGQFVSAREAVALKLAQGIHPVSFLYEKVFAEYKTKIRYS